MWFGIMVTKEIVSTRLNSSGSMFGRMPIHVGPEYSSEPRIFKRWAMTSSVGHMTPTQVEHNSQWDEDKGRTTCQTILRSLIWFS
jgi:hypothetical protein